MLGLGVTLINDGKIDAFDSKRQTDVESGYANIKESYL